MTPPIERAAFIFLSALVGAILSFAVFGFEIGTYDHPGKWVVDVFVCVLTGVIVALLGLWRADGREERLWGPKAQWRETREREDNGWRI